MTDCGWINAKHGLPAYGKPVLVFCEYCGNYGGVEVLMLQVFVDVKGIPELVWCDLSFNRKMSITVSAAWREIPPISEQVKEGL